MGEETVAFESNRSDTGRVSLPGQRRTIVVEGPLAHRMRRFVAAKNREQGVQVLSLPSLAARLAGGFARPAESIDLDNAIRLALDEGGFAELETMRQLPGMRRAAGRTLSRLWNSDVVLGTAGLQIARIADLHILEQRVRARMPDGAMTPQDLRDAAVSGVTHAKSVLGPVTLDRLHVVEPVWRPLLVALCGVVDVEWRDPVADDWTWFPGRVVHGQPDSCAKPSSVSCASPRAEVVEALRWARELIASGRAKPEEIAICAADPSDWDDHFVSLAGDASVPLHFSHGAPALDSWDGQFCAALADAMLHGLNQERLRRLFAYCAGRSPALRELPRDWAAGLPSSASLMELNQWRQSLKQLDSERSGGPGLSGMLVPVLERLVLGPPVAESLGELLLPPSARRLWNEALRSAPATAVDLSLKQLKVPDAHNPEVCAVWAPASHLANAPRPWVRLLGLTARSWPRAFKDDSLLPDHVISRTELVPDDATQRDRRAFGTITKWATGGCVLSRSRRTAQGGRVAGSPLLEPYGASTALSVMRIPPHAFSESDRLLARPEEGAASPRVAIASTCWRNWSSSKITPHDGNSRKSHPLIKQALEGVHSATSLRRMLRDPMAYVWRYALGWRFVVAEDQPLTLNPREFGELVHSLLRLTVDHLEPKPGFTHASRDDIDKALALAKVTVSEHWPLVRAVPPLLLWEHTVESASALALRALTNDTVIAGTRTWTEVPFGGDDARGAATAAPWDTSTPVVIPDTSVRIKGSIDRLDLREAGDFVRVTDYKTGKPPQNGAALTLDGGRELQRVIYAIATQALLPGPPRAVARLLCLQADPPKDLKLANVGSAIDATATFVTESMRSLQDGVFLLAGPDVAEEWNEYRLMRPASDAYLGRKSFAFGGVYRTLKKHWKEA